MYAVRRSVAVVGVALTTVAVTACGSSSPQQTGSGSRPQSAATAANGDPTVEVSNFSFGPMQLVVHTGATVTWKFDDSAKHNVKAKDGSFTSPDLSGGQTYQHTFDKPGTYEYLCSIHQYMTATVTVQ